MPGEFARSFIKDFFQNNLLFNEQLKLFGKKASLTRIKIPVLNIVSHFDDVAPLPACEALKQKVSDITDIYLPNGHLAIIMMPMIGINQFNYWDKIVSWMKLP
jgi:poly(3-hydroxyalkanoate) synthetase